MILPSDAWDMRRVSAVRTSTRCGRRERRSLRGSGWLRLPLILGDDDSPIRLAGRLRFVAQPDRPANRVEQEPEVAEVTVGGPVDHMPGDPIGVRLSSSSQARTASISDPASAFMMRSVR